MSDTTLSSPKVPFLSKIAFGTGAMGEAVYLGLFNTFITIYYNQAVGLSNTWIGVAVALAMIGDAISDPVVGIWSDRFKSRWGRRHPFLVVAPIPLAIAIYLMFNPPEFLTAQPEQNQMGLFVWLAIWIILSRALLTLYSVPHMALGGELSKDQHQRSQLFSANTVFFYVSGASFAFVAWSFFFSGERIRLTDGATVPGHLDPAAYVPLVLFACAVVVIAIWLCAAGTAKHIPELSQPDDNQERLTPWIMLKHIGRTFKNRNYVVLIVAYFFFMIASGIYDTLNVFINTYYWELQPDQIRWIGLVGAPAAMTGAILSPILMKRFDRKPVMLGSLTGVMIFAQLVVNLRLLELMPANGDPALLPLLIANAAGFTFSLGVGTVAIYSMLGDVIDQNELTTGKREEGLFYSARAFFAKASYSFGHFFAGVMLDYFVRLPFEAIPGQLDEDVLFRLGFTAGPIMGVAAIISLSIYTLYRLNREEHQNIIASINARKKSA